MNSNPRLPTTRALTALSCVFVMAGCASDAGSGSELPVGTGGDNTTSSGAAGKASSAAGESAGGSDAIGGALTGGAGGASGGSDTGGSPGNAGMDSTNGGNSTGFGGSSGMGSAGADSGGGATSSAGSAGSISTVPTCPKTACTTCGSGENKHNLNNDAWAGSLTLFISYSADTRNQTVDKGFTAKQWNDAVNSFDVPSFAKQVQATGAKNILLMLGQNTGYYCSPNTAYEKYARVAPGTRASVRDLPMEIADALAPMGIGMYLYLPEDVGWGDKKAAAGFGLSALAVGNWVVDSTFTPKWNAVVKEWADRYRTKVRGWFFDGYEARWGITQAMAQTYRNTCLAANPCGIVTFNGTNSNAVSDTQRGETRINTATALPAKGLPTSRWDKSDLQVMWDFPLQAAWGQEIEDNSPAIYSNTNLKTFITAAIKAQAVFALDVRTSFTGKLSTPIYQQLLAIKQ